MSRPTTTARCSLRPPPAGDASCWTTQRRVLARSSWAAIIVLEVEGSSMTDPSCANSLVFRTRGLVCGQPFGPNSQPPLREHGRERRTGAQKVSPLARRAPPQRTRSTTSRPAAGLSKRVDSGRALAARVPCRAGRPRLASIDKCRTASQGKEFGLESALRGIVQEWRAERTVDVRSYGDPGPSGRCRRFAGSDGSRLPRLAAPTARGPADHLHQQSKPQKGCD
jgi:hypothetical protein